MDVISKIMLDQVINIDFGCEWENNICVGIVERNEKPFKKMDRICCRGCFHNVGYLGVKKEDLPIEYQSYFSHPDGFLTTAGCGLPKDMRSTKCNIYVCRDANISNENRKLLISLEIEHDNNMRNK